MKDRKRIILAVGVWIVVVTALHLWLNVQWSVIFNNRQPVAKRKLNVAYIPVTCHLACPVTDYISAFAKSGTLFIPRMFQGFPEIKEALIADQMQAAFIVAPMAVALNTQGVPIKIVYLGHRYGSAVVVRKDGPVKSVPDLRGRTIAIPSRFSDERLIISKALHEFGMTDRDIHMVEMAPPDVAGALAAGAVDAFSMGEPYPSQSEMAGYGRVLFQARDYWPDYMSCVLVVRQNVIDQRPEAVQTLVDGIARSGLWLEKGKKYREDAADFVGRFYYRQNPALLRWALTKPLTRVMYTPLTPYKKDFDLVTRLMVESGLLERQPNFEDYVDSRFAEGAKDESAWVYEPGSGEAR